MKSVMRAIVATMVLFAVPAFAQDGSSADANMEILKQKLKADKKLLVANNMNLTDAESKAFWPLYDGYQKELEKINQQLIKTIGEYADAYNAGKGAIPDDKAKKLLNDAISADEQEVKLRRTYSEKIGKVLPGAKTTRYIQIENKIRAIIRIELAAQIPLVY